MQNAQIEIRRLENVVKERDATITSLEAEIVEHKRKFAVLNAKNKKNCLQFDKLETAY